MWANGFWVAAAGGVGVAEYARGTAQEQKKAATINAANKDLSFIV